MIPAPAAEDYARKSAEAVREHGRRFARYWNSLSPLAQGNALHQIERLARLGYSLRAAADFIESTRKIFSSVPLEKAVADFMADREARGLRLRPFRKLRASLEMFRDCAGAKLPLRDATETHVREFLSLNGWAAATRKTYLRDVRTFFRWAVRRKLLAESPADAVPLPLLEDKPPAILTPGEAAVLLDACQRERPSLLAWLALALFGGIRPEEARRLAWADVRPDAVNIEGAKAKTRHRRVVPLTRATARLAGHREGPRRCAAARGLAAEVWAHPHCGGLAGGLESERHAPLVLLLPFAASRERRAHGDDCRTF